MQKYKKFFNESTEFKTIDDFLSFDSDVEKGDFIFLKNKKDKEGNLIDLKITNLGLDSSWKNIKYKIDVFIKNKKVQSQIFKNWKALEDGLKSNNILIESTNNLSFYNEIKKILAPHGFHNNCIADIVNKFFFDYQDLKYMDIINELTSNWEMNEYTAKQLWTIADKMKIV